MTTFFVLVTLGQYCNTGGMAARLARWLDHRACNEAKHHSEKLYIKPSASTLLHLSGFTGRITDKKKPIVLEAVRCAGILHPLIHQTESPDFTEKDFPLLSRHSHFPIATLTTLSYLCPECCCRSWSEMYVWWQVFRLSLIGLQTLLWDYPTWRPSVTWLGGGDVVRT